VSTAGEASYIDVQTDALEAAVRRLDTGTAERILGHMRAEGVSGMDLFTTIHVVVDRVHHADPELQREAG
jgi:hypothetical protein